MNANDYDLIGQLTNIVDQNGYAVRVGVQVYQCLECGALVTMTDTHTMWHMDIEENI